MTSSLTNLDLSLIGIYILFCIYLGWRSSRHESTEGFLLADRKLGQFESIATMLSSQMGAGMVIGLAAFVYMYGLTVMWAFVGLGIGYFVFMFFAIKLRRLSEKKRYYTLAHYFFDNFGKTAGYSMAAITLITLMSGFITQLVGGATIISSLSSFSFGNSLLIVGATIGIYVTLGGFKAVVKTDILQFLAMIVLTALITIVFTGGIEVPYSELSFQELPFDNIVGFFLIGLLFPFASMDVWQRIYAAKNSKIAVRSVGATGILYFLVGPLLIGMGIAIKAQLPDLVNHDLALIEGFLQLLPAGMMGIGLVMICAFIMSSSDTALFTMTSVVLQDFYSQGKMIGTKKMVKLFRICLVLFIILGILVAYKLSVLDAALIWSGLMAIPSLVIITSWVWSRIPGYVIACMVSIGFAGTLHNILTVPVTEVIIITAIGWTLVGLGIGGSMNLVKRIKRFNCSQG